MNTEEKLRFVLADDVYIFSHAPEEYRLRKGVWNYNEATLHLQNESESVKQNIVNLLESLRDGNIVDLQQIFNDFNLTDGEKNKILEIFISLKYQNYLYSEDEMDVSKLITKILGGIPVEQFFASLSGQMQPVLYFADTEYSVNIAKTIAEDIKLPMTIMSEQEINELNDCDLTTKFDAIETIKQLEKFESMLDPYCCIIGCFERPRINFLRNLNRILIRQIKPLILTYLDGPFLSLLTIKPPETGCFECFEHRLLARMKDRALYQDFVKSTKEFHKQKGKTLLSPLTHSLTAAALFEGLLVSAIQKSKLAGRLLNIYLPILEIQVQDILRVPFCPGCGFIAESQMGEMYTSSKMIMDKLISKINVQK